MHRGTLKGGGVTHVGSDNLLFAYAHVAHDCVLGNHIVFANNASLAGHATVGDYAVLSGFVVIAQHCMVGAHSFIVGATAISKDILPYALISGQHGEKKKVYGLNMVGLKRKGFGKETIEKLKSAYRIIYQEGLTIEQALPKLDMMAGNCSEVQLIINAIKQSTRGIIR